MNACLSMPPLRVTVYGDILAYTIGTTFQTSKGHMIWIIQKVNRIPKHHCDGDDDDDDDDENDDDDHHHHHHNDKVQV